MVFNLSLCASIPPSFSLSLSVVPGGSLSGMSFQELGVCLGCQAAQGTVLPHLRSTQHPSLSSSYAGGVCRCQGWLETEGRVPPRSSKPGRASTPGTTICYPAASPSSRQMHIWPLLGACSCSNFLSLSLVNFSMYNSKQAQGNLAL